MWEPDVETDVEVPLTVSVENLIIEASRRLDEISQIRKKIPSADVVLAMAPRTPDGARQINITSEEWQVLVLVDGRRSVEDIATSTGAEAYQTTRLLFGLMNAGLITMPQSRALASRPPASARGSRPFRSKQADRWFDSEDSDATWSSSSSTKSEVRLRRLATRLPRLHFDERRGRATTTEEDVRRAESAGTGTRRSGRGRADPDRPASPSHEESSGPKVDRASGRARARRSLQRRGTSPALERCPRETATRRRSPPAPTQKRRVEDDDHVDRELIGRMIDGVKEL